MSIYRIDSEVDTRAQRLAEEVLKAAYLKTQQAILNDVRLQAFFSDVFRSRVFDWDEFMRGYLNGRGAKWEKKMRKLFAEKGYEPDAFEYYTEAAEKGRGFLERHRFLYER